MSDEHSVSSKKSYQTQLSKRSWNASQDASESTSRHLMPEREAHQTPEVAKREEANILRAKILVALIILLAVCGAASIESQAASENTLQNTSWPFYAVPDWSIKAQKLAMLTGVSDATVAMYPIVQIDEMDEFNAFAAQAVPKWYQESVENENTDMTAEEFWSKTVPFIFNITFDSENNPQIVPPTGINESIPVLHTYPLRFDQELGIMTTMFERGGVMSQVNIAKALRKPTIGFTALIDGLNVFPGSQIMQPIYDTANANTGERKM
eukprot:scaffold1807_cov140-Cylindrotheca_fusiformis.AAC.1